MKLNKILVLISKEKHSYRLINGFKCLGVEVDVIHSLNEYNLNKYDIVFLDHSADDDEIKINSDCIIFYDCEDNPEHFNPGKLFYSMVDKTNFYSKLVYYSGEKIFNKLTPIAIPITEYSICHNISLNCPTINSIPKIYFRGTPTYYAIASKNYTPINTNLYKSFKDTHSLGYDPEYGVLYNQRVDWLSQLESLDNFEQDVGLVFKEDIDCYSLKFQTKCFGNVGKFSKNQISYRDHLINLINNKICLCPLGHDRISYRVLDCVATGSIIMINDFEKRKMLYLPEYFIKIPDGADLLPYLEYVQSNYTNILKNSIDNKKMFQSKNQKTILSDFCKQLL
jgi:hypothetical protein